MTEFTPGVTPCFSPSSTGSFKSCQMAWILARQGWMLPKQTSKGDVAAAIGTAFHAAAEVYMLAIREGETPDVDAMLHIAMHSYNEWKVEADKVGYDDKASAEIVDAEKIITAMVIAFPKQEMLSALYKVVAVEEPLVGFGGSIPDLILRDSHGLVVVDYKTRVYTSPYYKEMEIRDFPRGRQMFHYS